MGNGAALSQLLTKWRRLLHELPWCALAATTDQRL
jgi:hypothetical protein